MTLSEYVCISIALVIVYTVIVTVLKVVTGQDFSAEYGIFAGVFGGEVLSCGLIKIFKLRREDAEYYSEDRKSYND